SVRVFRHSASLRWRHGRHLQPRRRAASCSARLAQANLPRWPLRRHPLRDGGGGLSGPLARQHTELVEPDESSVHVPATSLSRRTAGGVARGAQCGRLQPAKRSRLEAARSEARGGARFAVVVDRRHRLAAARRSRARRRVPPPRHPRRRCSGPPARARRRRPGGSARRGSERAPRRGAGAGGGGGGAERRLHRAHPPRQVPHDALPPRVREWGRCDGLLPARAARLAAWSLDAGGGRAAARLGQLSGAARAARKGGRAARFGARPHQGLLPADHRLWPQLLAAPPLRRLRRRPQLRLPLARPRRSLPQPVPRRDGAAAPAGLAADGRGAESTRGGDHPPRAAARVSL
ncbi:hypothetical protein EMIHUDRAFT_465494, partial [Emiliania huxleyi CCMP1516]|uniref:Uncharacterized protein n=2 Tax=Emiliania huxleyi TaxID=2903 RepID=A0A0D3IC41_EMIH1